MLNLLGRKVEIAKDNPMPFRPGSVESLRARYRAAMRNTFDLEGILLGTEFRPGERPENVFDSEDGIRLIVSRDAFGGELGTCIHISASFQANTESYAKSVREARLYGVREAMDRFRNRAAFRFFEISGEIRPVEFVGYSREKGVPHWIVRETLPDAATIDQDQG